MLGSAPADRIHHLPMWSWIPAGSFNLDIGLAPDTNVNNATSARLINSIYGNDTIELNDRARSRKGVGQFVGISGGVRLRLQDRVAMLIDADGQLINQSGTSADDSRNVLVSLTEAGRALLTEASHTHLDGL